VSPFLMVVYSWFFERRSITKKTHASVGGVRVQSIKINRAQDIIQV